MSALYSTKLKPGSAEHWASRRMRARAVREFSALFQTAELSAPSVAFWLGTRRPVRRAPPELSRVYKGDASRLLRKDFARH